jgi:short-subunit dehydrogenase
MVNLEGKVAIVTGAGSGIGAALAKALSQKGARLTLAARRLNRLEEVANQCLEETLVITADLTRDEDRNMIISQTFARWGRIDILVNNAGLGMYGHFLTTTEADWRQIFEVNLFGMVLLTHRALPIMIRQGAGTIVNMASIGGLIAHSDKVTPYVASKHAVVGFSRGLSRDLAGSGIRVLAVCPHLTDTDFFVLSPGAEEMAPVIAKYRSFMDSPEEVARGILDQLDSNRLVVFPTSKPAQAYEKQKDI